MPVGPTVWWVFLFSFWLHLSPQIDAQLVMDLALGTCNIINLEKRQKVLPLNRELLRWEKKVGRSNLLNWLVAICCYVVQTSWYSGIGTIVLTMVLATCSYSGTTLKSVIHENVNVNPGLSFSVQCSLACASIFTFQSVKMHVQAKSRIYIYTLH